MKYITQIILNYFFKSKQLYKKKKKLLKLKIFTSSNLSDPINKYGEILEISREIFFEATRDNGYIYLLEESLYYNVNSIIENIIIANYDTCLKLIRSISEQLILIKCLIQNDFRLSEDFVNWSVLRDYDNPRAKELLSEKGYKTYNRYIKELNDYILEKKTNINQKEINKIIKRLIDNKYGWYYKNCNLNKNITLKYIAEKENALNIYEMFMEYSKKIHNNDTRTIMIQNDNNMSMEYHILILLLFIQKHLIQMVIGSVDEAKYKKCDSMINKTIKVYYKKVKEYEEKYDRDGKILDVLNTNIDI